MTELKKYTLYFNPTTNISAFELASILLTVPLSAGDEPLGVAGISATEEQWKRLPPPLRGYFVKDNPLKPKAPEKPFWEPDDQTQQIQVVTPSAGAVPPSFQPQEQVAFAPPPQPVARELPKGPSPQPVRPVPSFYHNDGVESLYPDGQEIIPTPEGA